MRFPLEEAGLEAARIVLGRRREIYYLIGGSGAGKSTLSLGLASHCGLAVWDMDERIYGSYHSRFTPQRHPANTMWSSSDNGLAWLLSLTWKEFNAFNHASNAEYLDLLAEDVAALGPPARLLVDGGFSAPSILARVAPLDRIVCLVAPPGAGAELWDQPGDRLEMQRAVLALPEGEASWRKFREFDRRMTETIVSESRACGIPIVTRSPTIDTRMVVSTVSGLLGLI